MAAAAEHGILRILSTRTVRCRNEEEPTKMKMIHLTPWDLRLMSFNYIQKGLLFSNPTTHDDDEEHHHIAAALLSSFSRALGLFFPLAGRLSTAVAVDGGGDALTISLDCNNQGAEFIHASAPHVSVSDILTPLYIPAVVRSFFPLNGAIAHDGHSSPLLAAQVTELADGFFVACSLNHAVADGTSFWNFFNTWSHISRAVDGVDPPVFDRWFPGSISPPIRLPFKHHRDFVKRPVFPPTTECFFNFSGESIARLKAKAMEETNGGGGDQWVSSLQSLLAHVWRSVVRARAVGPGQETTYTLAVGYRSRVNPPLPRGYLGNALTGVMARAAAGEVLGRGLGWAAWQLNRAVASVSAAAAVVEWLESWSEAPSFPYADGMSPGNLLTGSSPRFDVFGNDFGWGPPVAVRSGDGNKSDGKVTVYQGRQEGEGSMGLEVCLSAAAMAALLQDEEFMEVVTGAA